MKKLSIQLSKYLMILSLVLITTFGMPVLAHATDTTYNPVPSDACQGDTANNPACTASDKNPIFGPDGIIITIANLIAWFAGAAAVIMIIFAGFRIVKSSGDTGKITQARETIIYALVGLVVIVLARFIVAFVISKT